MGAKEQSGRTWPSIFWARGTLAVTSNSPKFTLIAVKPVVKFATGVNDAGGKFAAGVIDTGGQQ